MAVETVIWVGTARMAYGGCVVVIVGGLVVAWWWSGGDLVMVWR